MVSLFGVPVLVFTLDTSIKLPPEKMEHNEDKQEKLETFRNLAMQNRLASIWKSSDDLTGKVAISIMKAKSEIVRPGWQRGNDFDEASLRREIMNLQKNLSEVQKALSIAEKEIVLLTADSDVAFDDCVFEFHYKYYRGNAQYYHEKKSFKLPELFRVISIAMVDVALSEIAIKIAMEKQLTGEKTHFSDEQAVKRVLIQLQALGLVNSKMGTDKDGRAHLYWSLTPKGIKTRNDMVLIKKNTMGEE